MNWEPGKEYITADGSRAKIYAVDGAGPFCIHGAVLQIQETPIGGFNTTWTVKGTPRTEPGHDYDLTTKEWDPTPRVTITKTDVYNAFEALRWNNGTEESAMVFELFCHNLGFPIEQKERGKRK